MSGVAIRCLTLITIRRKNLKGLAENLKSLLIIAIVLLLAGLSALRLMKIQIMGDKDIAAPEALAEAGTFTYTKEVRATRGEILDYSGNVLVPMTATPPLCIKKLSSPMIPRKATRNSSVFTMPSKTEA